jgi:hypothetical protein
MGGYRMSGPVWRERREREPMREIFVSYRREDAPSARLLCDRLRSRFGEESIFWDLDCIRPGENFLKAIEAAVQSCRVVLAIISPSWNNIDASGQHELMKPDDFVRFELLGALRAKKPIIPVRVQSAPMPTAQELPRGLKEFALLPAIELSDSRWEYDVGQLTEAICGEGRIELKRQPTSSESQPEASPMVNRPLDFTRGAVKSPWLDPKFLQARSREWEKRLQEENERKQNARQTNPPFYQTYSWWISTALSLGACIGVAFLTVPLVEWLLSNVLGWFSLSLDAATVNHPKLALALSGFGWAVVYSAVSAASYADDPAVGPKVFFLRGLIGGWVLALEDLEPDVGYVASFPFNMIVAWALSRSAAWAGFHFLGASPDMVAYTVLGIYTVPGAAWYLIVSLGQIL